MDHISQSAMYEWQIQDHFLHLYNLDPLRSLDMIHINHMKHIPQLKASMLW